MFQEYRSSHRRCSVEKGVLGNFAKFTGKHLCHRLLFNKVADLRPVLIVLNLKYTIPAVYSMVKHTLRILRLVMQDF